MNIVVTSAGQRVSLIRAFQKELKNLYPHGKVFTTDMHPHLSAACNISDQYFQVKRVTDPTYIDELIALCQHNNIWMVIPTIDTELLVLAQNKERFGKLGIHVIISSTSFVEECRDKRKISTFFLQRGIEVPKEVNKADPVFPLFIKRISKVVRTIMGEVKGRRLSESRKSHTGFSKFRYISVAIKL